jgi:hypothetical protein
VTNTGATANPLFDIDVTGVYTGNIFDIAFGAAATGHVINIDMNANLAGSAVVLDYGNGTRTGDMCQVTFDGDGTAPFWDINITNTGAGGTADYWDIDITGIFTGSVLDVTIGTAAATGDVISIALGTGVDAKAMIITGAGARVDDIFEMNDSSTGNSHTFDINFSGVYTGNCLDITYASAAATGNAVDLNMGTNLAGKAIDIALTGVRTGAGVLVTDDSTGNAPVFDLNISGIRTGNAIDITYSVAAATENAIDLNMGTNVAGKAIDIASAGTGDGCGITLAHTGNLADGSALVKISSTGSPAAADGNIVEIIQATGAGVVGNYALYIKATGANVEGLKVDDGAVVFDETLTVTGATTLTGKVTCTAGVQSAAVAREVTAAPGGTTGVIADGTSVVVVTSNDADKVLTLPTPTPGNIIWVLPNATGYELRSSDPATIAINGGTGANAESAVGANVLVRCVCASATAWVASTFSTVGTEAALEAAA